MYESNQFELNESNPYARATILAGQTVRRLRRAGHSSEEAKRLVATIINAEESAMLKGRRVFDEARIVDRLNRLPDKSGN